MATKQAVRKSTKGGGNGGVSRSGPRGSTASNGGGIAGFFSMLFGKKDPDAERKRRLRMIAKQISKTRYHFYKSGEVLAAFAKYVHDIYKVVAPVQATFQAMNNEKALQRYVIHFLMSDNQQKIMDEVSEENIVAKSKETPLKELSAFVKSRLEAFETEFTSERVAQMEMLYKQLMDFKDFVLFDYFFMLRKFDPTLKERDFGIPPHFGKCNGEYIADALKEFAALCATISQAVEWNTLMKLLKEMKGVSPIAPAVWKRVASRVQQLNESTVLDMMIALITGNPDYITVVKDSTVHIADPYIDKFKGDTNAVIKQLEENVKSGKVNDILSKLFGSLELDYMKNYTKEAAAAIAKRNLDTYLYCDAANYLKAFLLEFVKKDIREYCELVLVRGKWTSNTLAAPMSDAYNELLAESDKITKFDANLAEDAPVGMKFKTYLPRAGHDKEAINVLNRITSDANEQVKEFIVESTRDLITIGKTIKSLLEDDQKKTHEMVMNWSEIERAAERPMREMGTEVYKRIYLFVTLMQTCVGGAQ